jgi:hypothetical protein
MIVARLTAIDVAVLAPGAFVLGLIAGLVVASYLRNGRRNRE